MSSFHKPSMVGIDRFLSSSLSKKIKKNLNNNELKKLERELFLSNGMSIKLSMEHFDKFHLQCKKILNDSTSFEQKCLNQICKIKHSKDHTIIKIHDEEMINKILQFFGDDDIKNILKIIMKNEKTIPDILKESNIPKTSAYRKIENLINAGMIIETGKILSESKKISKYRCIFEQIVIKLKSDSFLIEGYLSKKELSKSTIMKKLEKL